MGSPLKRNNTMLNSDSSGQYYTLILLIAVSQPNYATITVLPTYIIYINILTCSCVSDIWGTSGYLWASSPVFHLMFVQWWNIANKQRTIKHTTSNMATQPSDRFVCRAYMSLQLILIPLTAMLCLGVHFPLITWLGEMKYEGKGGRVGLGDRLQQWFSWIWQAVDSWTTGSSFPSL